MLKDNDPEQVTELDGFISNCRPGMVLFDIGAHFGLFSLAALHYGGPNARAIAVDPSPTALRIMSIQAQLNHVTDRLSMVQASAGERTGWQDMVAVGVLAGGYFVAPTRDHTARELTHTRQVTLDSLVKDFGVTPTHIKIDVEGYEAAVLRGGGETLSRATAVLFVELHNQMVSERGGDPQETLTLLKSSGYQALTARGNRIMEEDILSRPLIRIIARKPSWPHRLWRALV